MTLHDIMGNLIKQKGSDVHVVAGSPPSIRIHGRLAPVEGAGVLSPKQTEEFIFPILTQEQKDYVTVNKELDFGFQYGDEARFRVNVYHANGAMAAALRLIPSAIAGIDELGLPSVFHQFSEFNQGLVLITGPTGEGKSTTLAAIIDEINHTRAAHIITIEDPVEFIHVPQKSIISQREINHDTHGWDVALRSALREDPDVVLVGEMRDYETIASAITIAETGHLVFATLHTATAAETVDRIIDVFPANQQSQIRMQLSTTLKVVASQRLLPSAQSGRVVATEIMILNNAVQNLIREGKTHQIDTVIQTSSNIGMMLFESHLQQLVQRGSITGETAVQYSFRPDEIQRLLGSA